MEILLGKGANVQVQDERGDTPIHTAVRAGNEKILKVRRALKTKGQIGVSFYSSMLRITCHRAFMPKNLQSWLGY